jgi:hypothetical protein
MNQSRKRNEILQVFDGYFANKSLIFNSIRSDLQEQIPKNFKQEPRSSGVFVLFLK